MALDKDFEGLLKEIKSRADIVDIISSYIQVYKKGRNYAAVCPFHDDHDPSLHIDKEKQTYHCYVCHSGGDVFSFVEKFEKVSFMEAVKKVCELINFDDPRLHKHETVKNVDENLVPLYKCINELQKFYEYGLTTDEGQIARDYLAKRKLSVEQQKKFSLGYALKDGKLAINYLKNKGFTLKNIEDIGIALVNLDNTSDNNAGRLIFPIKDINGQIVGFSARRLIDNDDAKYVNSPETRIFKKSKTLYNYHIAKQSVKHEGFVYIVEGFMDVFALDAIGISSSIALMGTSLTEEHIDLIRRLKVEVRLCLDGDGPGQKAMMQMMSMLDKAKISYRVVSLPGEIRDPDEILKQDGEDKLKEFVNKLVDPFNFALNYYQNSYVLGSMDDKKRVIRHFAPMLKNLGQGIEFDDYIYKLAKVTGISSQAIINYVNNFKPEVKEVPDFDMNDFKVKSYSKQSLDRSLRRLMNAEETVIMEMLQSKEAIEYYEQNIKYFRNKTYNTLANYLLEFVSTHSEVDVGMIMDMIQVNEEENKEQLLNELTRLSQNESEDDEHKYSAIAMDDCKNVIMEERVKIFNRQNTLDELKGKTTEEQAKIINEYYKNLKEN